MKVKMYFIFKRFNVLKSESVYKLSFVNAT